MYERLRNLYHQCFFFRNAEIRHALSYLQGCQQILDIGCGQGAFLTRLPWYQSVGLDLNLASLQFAHQLGQRVVCGNAIRLPFANGAFDGIYCAHLIEHLPPSHAHALLQEMARALRVSGVLVIQAPLLHERFFNDLTHVRPYNPEAILHYYTSFAHQSREGVSPTYDMIDAEFDVIDLKYRYAPLYSPMVWPEHQIPRFRVQLVVVAISFALYRLGIRGLRRTGYTLTLQRRK